MMVLESLEDSTGLRKGGHRLLPTDLRSCSVPPRREGGADPRPPPQTHAGIWQQEPEILSKKGDPRVNSDQKIRSNVHFLSSH